MRVAVGTPSRPLVGRLYRSGRLRMLTVAVEGPSDCDALPDFLVAGEHQYSKVGYNGRPSKDGNGTRYSVLYINRPVVVA